MPIPVLKSYSVIHKKRRSILGASVATLLASLVLGSSSQVSAASAVWNAAPTDGNWVTTGAENNWSTGVGTFPGATTGPASTDVATFSGASSQTAITINSATLNIGSITFAAGAGSYTIGATNGNALLLTSGGTIQTTGTANIETINAPLVIEGAGGTYTFTSNALAGTEVLNIGGGITGGAAGATVLTLTGANTGSNTISGVIGNGASTSLAVVKASTGTWVLGGENTYTGGTTVNGGTLQLGDGTNAASLVGMNGVNGSGGAGTVAVTVNNGATLQVMAGATITGGAGGVGAHSGNSTGGLGGTGVSLVSGGILTNGGTITGGVGGVNDGYDATGGAGGTGLSVGAGSFTNNGTVRGGAGSGGGSGGGGGTGIGISSAGSFTNIGIVLGGAGGEGAFGGAGGTGVSFSNGGSLTNSGTITAGAGATGSSAGAGGTGVSFSSGGSLTNSGTITAGAGGQGAAAGAGGTGVSFNSGGSLTNSGTIIGGGGGQGAAAGAGGTGVTFAGVAGTLDNQSGGVIIGGVSMGNFANSVTLETGSAISGVLNLGTSASATLTLAGAGTETYSAAVTGLTTFSGALIKTGAGTWTLDQAFNYSGSTTISAGTLKLGTPGALPSGTDVILGTASSAVAGAFDLNGNSQTVDGLALASGNTAGAGNIISSSTGSATLTVSSTATNSAFAGALQNGSGGLSLIKAGAGTTLTLTGTSTYTGATTVQAGTLQVDGSLGNTAVSVQNGATLGGTGSIAGAVTIMSGGILSPGDAPGTLTVGALTLTSGSIANYQLGTPGVIGSGVNDLTIVNGNLTLGGTLNITNAGSFGPGGYELFQYSGALTNNTLAIGTVPATYTSANFIVVTGVANQVDLIVVPNGGAATTQFWDGAVTGGTGTIAGGSGTWNNFSTNFTNAAGTTNSGWQNGIAVFSAPSPAQASSTVTLSGAINFSGLMFTGGAYTIVSDGVAGTSFTAIGTPTNSDNFAHVSVSSGITATIDAAIGGSAGISKDGAGTLVLAAVETYTGGTTVNTGTLQLGDGTNAASLTGMNGGNGSGVAGADAVTVNNSATLEVMANATITGGAGGVGANSGKTTGGAGGMGVSFLSGGILTNGGTITGGAGGEGGNNGVGAAGGAGGTGVSFNSGGSLTNSGTITGGSGSVGGTFGGAGGTGVSFSSGGSLTNSGTITGGGSGAGVTFAGAAGTLVNLNGGVINDGVSMGNYANSVTLNIGSTINGGLDIGTSASATLTLTGGGNGGTQTYSQAVTGANATTFNGSLIKAGAGTWILDQPFTYGGGTAINGGALVVNNTTGSGTGSGPVAVNSGGTLGGSGTIAGPVTLTTGGVIAPGAVTPGTTLHAASLTWNGGGTLSLQLGTASDLLALTGALTKSTVTTGAYTLDIINSGGLGSQSTYTLVDFGSTTFAASDFTLALPTGYSGTLVETATALDIELTFNTSGLLIQNVGGPMTPVTANFTVTGAGMTGAPGASDTINSLIMPDGSSLLIFNTLAITSGNVTQTGGSAAITGGTLYGPNGLQFDVLGNLFLEGIVSGNSTLTGGGELYLDGSLLGNLQILQGILGGNGSISGNLINAGTVSPGHSPGTLTVGGNYTQTSSGVLKIEIGGSNAGQFDLLKVGGQASLNGALQLVPLNNFNLTRGDKITFLTAGQGIAGSFASVSNGFTSDTILAPTVIYGPNSVALEAVQGSFEKFAEASRLTPNEVAVAGALDSVVSNGKANALINYLDARPLNKLPGDFERLDPEQLTSLFTVGVSLAEVQSLNLQRRAEDIRSGSSGFSAAGFAMNGANPGYDGSLDITTGVAGTAGPDGKDGLESKEVMPVAPVDQRWGAFLSGTGDWVNVGDTHDARGYDIDSGGFTLGVDYKVCEHFAVGLSFGYTGTTADLTDRGRIFVDGGKAGIYTTAYSGGWYIDTAVNGGYNSYDTRRSALQGQAGGSADGGEVNALFGTGYDFKKGALTFGPTTTFNYTYLGLDGFSEHGSLAPLDIHGSNEESLRSALGFKVNYEWKVGKVLIKPELRAAWQHEFGDTTYALDSNLVNGAGDVFTADGPKIGRDSALLSGGFAIQLSERCSTYIYYDGVLGCANYHSSSVSGGFRVEF